MSGINDVLRGCFEGMGVPYSALLCFVCMCVRAPFSLLIMLYLHCRITWNVAEPYPDALKHTERCKCEVFMILHLVLYNRPHEQQTLPNLIQRSLYKASISITQRHCLLREVTARPQTPDRAKRSPSMTCFLPSFLSLFLLSSLRLSVCVCLQWKKEHMFPSKGRRIKHKLFLVKGWALFQGQTETLSGLQRAIRALEPAQVYTEYIWSVNICIERINGLDRPLITEQHWLQVSLTAEEHSRTVKSL